MRKVLLLTDIDFWLNDAGHRVRIHALVDFVSHYVQLSVLYIGNGCNERLKQHFKEKGIELIGLYDSKIKFIEEYGPKVRSLFLYRIFDSIIIEFIENTIFLKYLNLSHALILLDAIDVASERTEAFKKFNYQNPSFQISADMEAKLLAVYDYVLALTTHDVNKINAMTGSSKAVLCPHPVPVVHHPWRKEVKEIGFLGSIYQPNVDAMNFFIDRCWNKIVSRYDVTLSVYGGVAQKIEIGNHKQIVLGGHLKTTEQFYSNIDLFVNPVRFGAGLKSKNVEAMANGIPLLTTNHGARGLEPAINSAFLIGNEPDEIVQKVSLLIDTPTLRETLGKNSLTYISKYFSPETCFSNLIKILTDE